MDYESRLLLDEERPPEEGDDMMNAPLRTTVAYLLRRIGELGGDNGTKRLELSSSSNPEIGAIMVTVSVDILP